MLSSFLLPSLHRARRMAIGHDEFSHFTAATFSRVSRQLSMASTACGPFLYPQIWGRDTNSLGRHRACGKTKRSWLDWHASSLDVRTSASSVESLSSVEAPEFHIMSITAATAVKTFSSRLPQFGNRI
jgi:hypothetical protein